MTITYEHTPPTGGKSFVYCIVNHERSAVKIGVSKDPYRRLKQLQTAVPDALTLFAKMPGGRRLEKAFHHDFASRRKRGEWFDNGDGSLTALFGKMAWEHSIKGVA